RVERSEESVFDVHLAAGEQPHPARFAGVGVAHQRHALDLLPALAPGLLGALRLLQLGAQCADAAAQFLFLQLGAGVTLAAAATTTSLLRQETLLITDARRFVLEARQLDFDLGDPRARATLEHAQDHLRSI